MKWGLSKSFEPLRVTRLKNVVQIHSLTHRFQLQKKANYAHFWKHTLKKCSKMCLTRLFFLASKLFSSMCRIVSNMSCFLSYNPSSPSLFLNFTHQSKNKQSLMITPFFLFQLFFFPQLHSGLGYTKNDFRCFKFLIISWW